MKNRFTCDVKCPSCHRRFKSSRTTIKHGLTKHGLTLDGRRLDFYDSSEETVTLPEAKKISPARLELYKSWIASLTERVGEALHPALPGKLKISYTACIYYCDYDGRYCHTTFTSFSD